MTICDEDRVILIDSIKKSYKNTKLEGYTNILEEYPNIVERRLSGGNHITPESIIYNVDYDHRETCKFNKEIKPKNHLSLRENIREFLINNLENEFDSDKEFIDFFVERSKNIAYCDYELTRMQLEDYYRTLRELDVTDNNDVPILLTNESSNGKDPLLELTEQVQNKSWNNPPSIDMYGLHKIEDPNNGSSHKVVIRITDRYEDELERKVFEYEVSQVEDSLDKNQISHWLLRSEEPLTPLNENAFEFFDSNPMN